MATQQLTENTQAQDRRSYAAACDALRKQLERGYSLVKAIELAQRDGDDYAIEHLAASAKDLLCDLDHLELIEQAFGIERPLTQQLDA